MAMLPLTGDLSIYELVQHWLAVHESFARDAEALPSGATKVVRLESLVAEPDRVVTEIIQWLGLAGLDDMDENEWENWKLDLRTEPNEKYWEFYREGLDAQRLFREMHKRIVQDFGRRILNVSGYDVREVPEA